MDESGFLCSQVGMSVLHDRMAEKQELEGLLLALCCPEGCRLFLVHPSGAGAVPGGKHD